MKNIRIILLILLSLFMFTACNTNNGNPDDSDDKQEENNQNQFKYEPPVLTLTDSTVTWERVMGSVQYEILINGETKIYQNHVTDYYLKETSTFKMRIVDIYNNPLSDWSNEVNYTEPEKVYYTITYKSPEGYFEDFEKEYVVGENYGVPTPEVEGYTFIGWYLDEVYTEDTVLHFSIPYSITTDSTMYAKYKPNKYKLNYNDYMSWVEFYSEGKFVDFCSVGSNTPVLSYPKQPKRDGYIFTGWYTDEECTNFFSPNSYLTEDINLYAGWFPESKLMYTGKFNDNNYDWDFLDSDVKSSVRVYTGASILAPVRLSFTVWEEKTYQLQYRILKFNAKCTMYFVDETNKKFIAKEYPDFSSDFESIEFEGVPGNIYTIYLFNVNEDLDIEILMPNSNPEIYPSTPNSAYLTYNEYFTLPTFEKENLQFYGYFTEENGQGIQITDGDGNSLQPYSWTDNVKIYPYYSDITYNVNYESNGGNLASGESFITSYLEKDLPIKLPILTKTGCEFEGWYNNPQFEGEQLTSIEQVSERNITLYAKFSKIDYTLTTYLGSHDTNPEIVSSDTINYNDTYSLLNSVSNGYEIDNYYYLVDGNKVNIEQTGNYLFENDLEVYIEYSPIEYNITYNLNDGTLENDLELKHTYNVTDSYSLPDLVKENYVFDGWYESEDFVGEKVENIALGTTGDKVFYAKFREREYKITVYFGSHRGSTQLVEEISVFHNDVYKLNKEIVPGYTIRDYYYLFSDGSEMSVNDSDVFTYTDDLVLYSLYDVNSYDITYHMNEGALNEYDVLPSNYNITSYLILPELNKYGFVFEGWYDNKDFSGEALTAINQGTIGNLELYAKFMQYTYKITVDNSAYNLDNIKIDAIYTLDYSIPFTVIDGAEFKGYYYAPNGEGGQVCDSSGKSISEYSWEDDVTLYPYYDPEIFTINYSYIGGYLNPERTYYYTVFDDIIELPIVYYLDYKFLGWYTDSEFKSEPLFTIDPKTMENYYLYARCEEVYYNCDIAYDDINITFDLQYDDKKIVQTIDYESGQYTFEYPENPVREGYFFGGWFKTPECDENDKIFLGSFPTGYPTIYAKWIEIPEAISNETYEIVHLDFTDCTKDSPLNYTISQNCTADKPTLFIMLLDPTNDLAHINLKGDAEVNVSVGAFGGDNTYYESASYTLSSEYTLTNQSCMKYSILMFYVYGNGTEFNINLYVEGMYDYPTIDICNKYIKHSDRLQVFKTIGDYVLQGIYTEPNGQGELISSDWEVLPEYLYEGIVIYPYYVLKEA